MEHGLRMELRRCCCGNEACGFERDLAEAKGPPWAAVPSRFAGTSNMGLWSSLGEGEGEELRLLMLFNSTALGVGDMAEMVEM